MQPFRELALLSAVLIYAVLLFPVLLLGLAIPYAVLRLGEQKSEEPDPQLGVRTALFFFFSLSVILALSGLTIIAVDFVQERGLGFRRGGGRGWPMAEFKLNSEFTEQKRLGMGLVVGGGIFGLLHLVLLALLRGNRRWPAARRVFNGWRLAIHGLVLLSTFTALAVVFLQENPQMQTVRTLVAILTVWVPAWVIDLFLLRLRSKRPRATVPTRPLSLRSPGD
jgi:hypothetical protein